MSFIYFDHPRTIISETELPYQPGFIGEFNLTEEQKLYGVWNGDSIIVTDRQKEIVRREFAETIEGKKSAKIDQVKEKLNEIFETGFTYDSKNYHSDSTALVQVSAALSGLSAGAGFPEGYTWGTKDGERIVFIDAQSFKNFGIAFLTFYDSKMKSSKNKINSILALATIQEVDQFQIGEI